MDRVSQVSISCNQADITRQSISNRRNESLSALEAADVLSSPGPQCPCNPPRTIITTNSHKRESSWDRSQSNPAVKLQHYAVTHSISRPHDTEDARSAVDNIKPLGLASSAISDDMLVIRHNYNGREHGYIPEPASEYSSIFATALTLR